MRAFPTARVFRDQVIPTGGMLLRDYFAAKAMQGLLANPYLGDACPSEITEWAYDQADAMLEARGPDE